MRSMGSEFDQLAPPPVAEILATGQRLAPRAGGLGPRSFTSRVPSAFRERHRANFIHVKFKEDTVSHKKTLHHDHRLSVNITQAMSDRLDHITKLRSVTKAELIREAVRIFLDQQEDLAGSRKFFTKSFQRRMDHVDWQFSVVMHMLAVIALFQLKVFARDTQVSAGDFLQHALEQALATDWQRELHHARTLQAGRNRKPPTE